MKRSIEPSTPSTSRAGRFTTAQVLSMLESDNENELLNDVDYPSDEIASSSDSESESVQSDPDPSNVNAQDDVSDNGGGDAPPPSQRRRCAVNTVHMLDKGWSKT